MNGHHIEARHVPSGRENVVQESSNNGNRSTQSAMCGQFASLGAGSSHHRRYRHKKKQYQEKSPALNSSNTRKEQGQGAPSYQEISSSPNHRQHVSKKKQVLSHPPAIIEDPNAIGLARESALNTPPRSQIASNPEKNQVPTTPPGIDTVTQQASKLDKATDYHPREDALESDPVREFHANTAHDIVFRQQLQQQDIDYYVHQHNYQPQIARNNGGVHEPPLQDEDVSMSIPSVLEIPLPTALRSNSPPRRFNPAELLEEDSVSLITGDTTSLVTGRCESIDLERLLQQSDRRKSDAARQRGSLLNANRKVRRSVVEENAIVEGLIQQGFTGGLARTLIHNTDSFSVRIWLVNNSGSMNHNDGHLVVQSKNGKFQNARCTRWEEVQSCVLWHAELSSTLDAPMAVRLLNDPGVHIGPQQMGIAASMTQNAQDEMTILKQVLHTCHPGGRTSELNSHLSDICNSVLAMAPRLRQRRERVAIIIVTDGLPTDSEGNEGEDVIAEFFDILEMLQALPVWVVIRLCTDEERVVDFYNDLDERMAYASTDLSDNNVNLDVLDDFLSEAIEVHEHNPWLNYALPIHLCRESGVSSEAFDALDNRPLLPKELVEFIQLLFDTKCYADPEDDYFEFRDFVQDLIKNDRTGLFNPIKRKFLPWIDLKELDHMYGSDSFKAESSCSCVIQ